MSFVLIAVVFLRLAWCRSNMVCPLVRPLVVPVGSFADVDVAFMYSIRVPNVSPRRSYLFLEDEWLVVLLVRPSIGTSRKIKFLLFVAACVL